MTRVQGVRAARAVGAALLVLAAAAPVFGAGDEFANRVALGFRVSMPGYDVTVVDPLTLKISKDGKETVQINLDRIAKYCAAEPTDCDRVVADFIAKSRDMADVANLPTTGAQLRAVVRPQPYVAEMARLMAGAPKPTRPVSRPLAGDLVELCFFDMPTTMRPANAVELSALGLDAPAALALCEKNVAAQLSPIDPDAGEKIGDIGVIDGDVYVSSYVLLHDRWAALAGRYGGHLLVAIPSSNEILYAPDRGPDSVSALRSATHFAATHAERMISETVLRWTPAGWDVVQDQ